MRRWDIFGLGYLALVRQPRDQLAGVVQGRESGCAARRCSVLDRRRELPARAVESIVGDMCSSRGLPRRLALRLSPDSCVTAPLDRTRLVPCLKRRPEEGEQFGRLLSVSPPVSIEEAGHGPAVLLHCRTQPSVTPAATL